MNIKIISRMAFNGARLKIEARDKRSAVCFCLTWLLTAIICSCSPHISTGGRAKPSTPASSQLVSATSMRESATETQASAVTAGALDFTLVNFTGLEIYTIYVSPHDSAAWEENVIGRDRLSDGEFVEIRFAPEEQTLMWDLRVEDHDGNNAEWRNLNLLQISRITLRRGGNVVIAEAQ